MGRATGPEAVGYTEGYDEGYTGYYILGYSLLLGEELPDLG